MCDAVRPMPAVRGAHGAGPLTSLKPVADLIICNGQHATANMQHASQRRAVSERPCLHVSSRASLCCRRKGRIGDGAHRRQRCNLPFKMIASKNGLFEFLAAHHPQRQVERRKLCTIPSSNHMTSHRPRRGWTNAFPYVVLASSLRT